MRLSEAVMLGSTQLKLDPNVFRGYGCGCLIGMGMNAQGINLLEVAGSSSNTQANAVLGHYPWLGKLFQVPEMLRNVHLEVDKYYIRYAHVRQVYRAPAIEIISCFAVMVQAGAVTLDAAVDWIRENEPQETAEEKREAVEIFCDNLVRDSEEVLK